jgi:hypothetical protein
VNIHSNPMKMQLVRFKDLGSTACFSYTTKFVYWWMNMMQIIAFVMTTNERPSKSKNIQLKKVGFYPAWDFIIIIHCND